MCGHAALVSVVEVCAITVLANAASTALTSTRHDHTRRCHCPKESLASTVNECRVSGNDGCEGAVSMAEVSTPRPRIRCARAVWHEAASFVAPTSSLRAANFDWRLGILAILGSGTSRIRNTNPYRLGVRGAPTVEHPWPPSAICNARSAQRQTSGHARELTA